MWPFGKGKSKEKDNVTKDNDKAKKKSGSHKVVHEQSEDFLSMEFDNVNADGTIDMSQMDLDMDMTDSMKEPEVNVNLIRLEYSWIAELFCCLIFIS
jgi:hypothetical protein